MPSGKLNNLIYRAALLLTPSPATLLRNRSAGRSLTHAQRYTRILNRNRVQGASLLLRDGKSEGCVFTSFADRKPCDERTLFRVASLTKMVTACTVLILCDQGAFALDDEARFLLPGEPEAIRGVTVRHLLSHTSGLRDTPAMDAALAKSEPFSTVLASPGVIAARPGETFAYCNFGFGLLGCIIEKATGKVRWAYALDSYSYSSPVAVYNESGRGWIIQAESDGTVHVIDGTTGAMIQSVTLEGAINGSPAVYRKILVIGTQGKNSSYIYGFQLETDE